jgi:hypothetical protein
MVKQKARNEEREKKQAEEMEKEKALKEGGMEQDRSEAVGTSEEADKSQDGGEEFHDEEIPEVVLAEERNTHEGFETGTVEEDSGEAEEGAEEGSLPAAYAPRDEQVATKDKAKNHHQKVKRKGMLDVWKEQRARRKARIQREQR